MAACNGHALQWCWVISGVWGIDLGFFEMSLVHCDCHAVVTDKLLPLIQIFRKLSKSGVHSRPSDGKIKWWSLEQDGIGYKASVHPRSHESRINLRTFILPDTD